NFLKCKIWHTCTRAHKTTYHCISQISSSRICSRCKEWATILNGVTPSTVVTVCHYLNRVQILKALSFVLISSQIDLIDCINMVLTLLSLGMSYALSILSLPAETAADKYQPCVSNT